MDCQLNSVIGIREDEAIFIFACYFCVCAVYLAHDGSSQTTGTSCQCS